ncbi:MAG: hypothetical protein QXV23_05195 [Candidatus Bathyarchaeia archaeon]
MYGEESKGAEEARRECDQEKAMHQALSTVIERLKEGLRKGIPLDELLSAYGLTISQFNALQAKDAELRQLWDDINELMLLRAERILYERGLEGDTTALVAFLKARHPAFKGESRGRKATVLKIRALQSGGERKKDEGEKHDKPASED